MRTLSFATALMLAPAMATPAPQFTDAVLEKAAGVYRPNIERMLFKDIAQRLEPSERARLQGLRLETPLRVGHPMNFYAEAHSRRIIVPISTVRFLDEYARVFAWFQSRGCRAEYVLSYLAEAIGRDASLPGPLAAFGLSDGILEDTYTDDVSQKLLKSAVYFALGHEVGHVLENHAGNAAAGAFSVDQEITADDFAIDIYRRTGVPPAGVVTYFFAAQFFDSDHPGATHPTSSQRIARIAAAMRANPAAFAWAEPDPNRAAGQVVEMADQLEGIAEHLKDPDYRRNRIAGLEALYPLASWRTACPE